MSVKKRMARHDLGFKGELREAIRREQFTLFYQPQFYTKSRRVAGFEVLIRWNHPARGLVLPGEFVPFLERTGLIIPLGYWVVSQAIREFADFCRSGANDVSISINISPIQLRDGAFADVLEACASKFGVDCSKVIIEITESALIDLSHAQHILERLRVLGVRIAIDDFGVGYLGLSSLMKLRPEILKLDKSLIDDIAVDGRVVVVVR